MQLMLIPGGFKKWEVAQDFAVQTKHGTIVVPKGFPTDLASTPRLSWIILPPFGRYTQASVVHDYLYSLPMYDRKTADQIFYELMIKFKTYKWKATIMYYAVRIFGGLYKTK